jgi:transglutaminase-like putative cysteine protease
MTKKNETRTLKLLLPGQYQLATARLRCSGKASVPLMDGTPAELTEINSEIQIGENQPNYSTIWTDADGGIVRTFSPALRLVAYRTDEATATSIDGDDLVAVAIPVKGDFARPSEATRVTFKITIAATSDAENPSELKPVPGQYVRAGDGFYQLLVSRQEESDLTGFAASQLAPSDADRQPNHFVDATTTLVRRFADAAIASSDMSDREVAEELTRTAHRLIAEKRDPSGFSRASEVARDGVGDSTDQAILLAALLRARKIPSQLAIGIKFSPGEPNRMTYHAWTLAHVGGDWLHLDATDGSVAAADRVALLTTNLSGGNEYKALIPLLDVIGRIEVEVLRAQY